MISNDLYEKRKTLLAKRIQAAEGEKKTHVISKRPLQASIPLSFSQQRFWFMEQWDPGKATYNITHALRLSGNINIDLIEIALNEIIRRHEVLHMIYGELDEEPQLELVENAKINLSLISLNKMKTKLSDSEINQHIDTEINQPFDLTSELPIRVKLLQTAEDEHILIIVLHHIAGDAWSVGILFHEFMTLYSNYITGEEVQLSNLPIQYSDYSYWQKNTLSQEAFAHQLQYWKEIFIKEIPPLELPTDRPRPAIKTIHGNTYRFSLPTQLAESVRLAVKKESITTFMFLLSGLQILLQYYTGQNDITIGTTIAGRNRSELENLMGPFINTMVLRNDLSGDQSVSQLLQQVKDVALDAFTNQDLPFEKLVEEIKPPRCLDRSPLFQVMLTFHNIPRSKLQLPGLEVEQLDINTQTTKFDLNFSFSDDGTTFYGNVTYNTDLFNLETIKRMVDHYINVLGEMTAFPLKSIHNLNILCQAEYDKMVVGWNNEQIEYPCFKGMHQLFEHQVELVPNEVAVVFENQKLTYGELNERSNQLANYLRSLGVGPETKVAIFMDRSLELMIGIMGVLKAGGAFVPLDPIYPSQRVQFILEDLKIPVVLTHSSYAEEFDSSNVKILSLDKVRDELFGFGVDNLPNIVAPDNLMYVLFTSGSTGRPKGVGVQHNNFFNYINGLIHRLELKQRLSYAIVSTFAADLGTTMIWGALATGGELHIISYERAADPVAFREYWQKNPIDVIKLVPSHFEMLQGQTYTKDILPRKILIFAGEASHWGMIEKIKALNPACAIQNHYGPTETVVSTLTYPVDLNKDHPKTFAVPLGKPIPNTNAYILNEYLKPVPIGVLGELYVGGAGVSRGYLNRPDLTAERFIPDPFSLQPGQRLYRTGDRVRFLHDGSIEFLDRIDNQVKIRGFRIELGEIESLLQSYPGIRDSIVIAREDIPGDKRLVAYLILNDFDASNFQQSELRELLRSYLPDYMIPSAFMILDKIPLNSNGKVDRAKLPVPEIMPRGFDNNYTAPQNELQIKISAIWCEVLGIENIGIDENFFDLGGESFKSVRVVRKIDPTLSVISLFKNPTIRGLADLLGKDLGTNNDLLLELTKPFADKDRIASLVCVPYG
ncbi:MAG: amino acid adenylation domain-containing protein, partial [Oscillospiraceae bacterium]